MDFNMLVDNVVTGNESGVIVQVNMMLASGIAPLEIINKGLLTGMDIVGEQFKSGQMFIPEVLMSSCAMNAGMDLVKPCMGDAEIPTLGTVVIGTVKGDLHDIGKNLVVMMLESSGFKVINLGVDVTKDKFIKAAKENGANIIAMSAMLTTTMEYMQDIVDDCKKENLDVDFMVGGAPVTPMFGNRIGALYTADAAGAVSKAKSILK